MEGVAELEQSRREKVLSQVYYMREMIGRFAPLVNHNSIATWLEIVKFAPSLTADVRASTVFGIIWEEYNGQRIGHADGFELAIEVAEPESGQSGGSGEQAEGADGGAAAVDDDLLPEPAAGREDTSE
jgi:hypothetical protein